MYLPPNLKTWVQVAGEALLQTRNLGRGKVMKARKRPTKHFATIAREAVSASTQRCLPFRGTRLGRSLGCQSLSEAFSTLPRWPSELWRRRTGRVQTCFSCFWNK